MSIGFNGDQVPCCFRPGPLGRSYHALRRPKTSGNKIDIMRELLEGAATSARATNGRRARLSTFPTRISASSGSLTAGGAAAMVTASEAML